jgi:hypothetical protein
MRYSTARSGLLNAALMALSISSRAKPISIMFVIAASRCAPMARAEGSLKLAPAGDGVSGTVTLDDDAAGACAGAGGGAAAFEVCTGVEGALAGVEELDAAGVALGCDVLARREIAARFGRGAHLREHAHYETLLLDLVKFDSFVIRKNLAYALSETHLVATHRLTCQSR